MKPTNQIGRDTKWPVSDEDTMQTIVQNGNELRRRTGLLEQVTDLRSSDPSMSATCIQYTHDGFAPAAHRHLT